MSRIGIDLDDCVAEFAKGLLVFTNQHRDTRYVVQDLKSWDWYTHLDKDEHWFKAAIDYYIANGEFTRAEAVPGAVDAIQHLQRDGHDVYFITSRSSKAIHDTYDWMDAHGLGIKNIFFDRDKAWIAKRLGLDTFIDDNLTNLDAVANAGVSTICFDRPWNRAFSTRAHMRYGKWDDIYKHIEDEAWRRA